MMHNTTLFKVRLMKQNGNCFDEDIRPISNKMPQVIVLNGVCYWNNQRKIATHNDVRWLYHEVFAYFLEDSEE